MANFKKNTHENQFLYKNVCDWLIDANITF